VQIPSVYRLDKMILAARILKRLPNSFTLEVNLSVPVGITILFGASGAGKTTLLRCLAGLSRPEAGTIRIGSRELFDSEQSLDLPVPRRNIGYVFQNLALFPHMTVEENVQFGLGDMDPADRREHTQKIVESFRISHLVKRKPGEISGGERQRVALARSLVTSPHLLLLDEPLSALDHAIQSRIIEDLRAWNAAHRIPILYVTHAHREAFALGERLIVLENGRIVAEGTPQEVLTSPDYEPVAQLAGFENFFDATVTSIRGDSGTMQCRVQETDIDLEVPLARVAAGSKIRIAVRAGDIMVASEMPRGLSARNVIPGRIISFVQQGTLVIAEVDAGQRFEVHITPHAREALQLRADSRIWLVIKTYSCHIVSS
jgi:molybdate transport system ATP-binding protein